MQQTDLLDVLPVAVYATDADGKITYYNDAAAKLWGHRPELGTSQWCGSWRLYWPDGTPLAHDQCPMAETLRTGRPVRGVEAVAERPDGTRVLFLPYPTPLRDAAGKLTGAINLLVDLSEPGQLQLDTARLAAIVSSSDDAIISKTLDGRITTWNAGAERVFGYKSAEIVGELITRIIPPESQAEEHQIVAKLRRGERIQHYETVRVTKDGRRIDISLSVSPLYDKFGKIIGASKVARDITERKRAEKLQHLLINELNHRIKNTLATVQAMASQSLLRAQSHTDFVASFTGRVQALARAHSLITESAMQGADVMQLVRDQVLIGVADDERITCSGPRLTLDRQSTIHVALMLHELGTNARKYGALSGPNGHLSVSWELQTDSRRTLILRWKESEGPEVSAPAARGFGTILIEQTVQAHGGDASIHYQAGGLSCEIILPLPEEDLVSKELYAITRQHASAPLHVERSVNRSSLTGKRILVVEDEPLLLLDIEMSLQTAGCVVIGPAGTLEKAKTLVADNEFDAALVDANLAGQRVDELAATLTRRNIPFAFVTGYGREALPRAFREAIMLSKPFSSEQLLGMVRTLLHQDAAIVQLRQKKI